MTFVYLKAKYLFPCDCCGLCCMSISHIQALREFDLGNGVCKHFDLQTKLCKIYHTRPIICRIDTMYEKFFCSTMSKEEFYALNQQACQILKS